MAVIGNAIHTRAKQNKLSAFQMFGIAGFQIRLSRMFSFVKRRGSL